MATTAEGFGISLAFYFGVMFIVFGLFSYWRRVSWTERFYANNAYAPPPGKRKPKKIGKSLMGWVKTTLGISEKEVLAVAGMDALMYLKTLRFSMEVFVLVTFFVSAIILPINLTSGNVDELLGKSYDPNSVSEFIEWWLPPENAPSPEEESDKAETIEAPDIYNTSIGPAPPGLIWWEYLDNVPALPPVSDVYGPEYVNYSWRYDDSYTVVKYEFTDLDKTTMTNVPEKSDRLYAHAIVTWLLTILVLWRLSVYCKSALNLRLHFLQHSSQGAESRTVLCTDVPGVISGTIFDRLGGNLLKFVPKSVLDKARRRVESVSGGASFLKDRVPETVDSPGQSQTFVDATESAEDDVGDVGNSVPDRWMDAAQKLQNGRSVEDLVNEEFRDLYQDNFLHAFLVYDTTVLDKLVKSYASLKTKAFKALDVSISKFTKGKKVKVQKTTVLGSTLGDWGKEKYGVKPKKVDAFEFYADRLTFLREQIKEEQERARSKHYASAFVTFKTRKSQVIASHAMMSEDLSAWICQPAPQPQEIIWNNLQLRAWERDSRHKTYLVSYWVLVAFYMIPVSAAQVLISTNSLVGFLETIPIASALLTAILPGLALRIFMILLPMIIVVMLRKAGCISASQVDHGLVSYIFIFQVVTVFIGSFIAGTFANQFEQLIKDPGSIVQIFGTAAPQTGIFFMTYLLVQACFEIPFDIFDVVGLIIFKAMLAIAATDSAKQRVLASKSNFNYGKMVPDDSMVFLLGLAFSIACPLIAPIALIYYGTRYLVSKYNLVYRIEEVYQSGGQIWLRVFDQYITGLVVFQLLMIFLLAIKEIIGPPIIVLPLPFLTLAVGSSIRSKYTKPMSSLSLLCAEDRDRQEEHAQSLIEEEAYMSPSFTFDEKDHEDVINQCNVLKQAQETGDFSILAGLVGQDLEKQEQEPLSS